MMFNKAIKSLLLATVFGALLLSCGNDDDDGTPCTFLLNGTVTDALTGLPVDSIKVNMSAVSLLGSTDPILFFPIVEYTKAGSFSMEVECQSEFKPFHLGYNDPLNRYFFEGVINHYKNMDSQIDLLLCRQAYAVLNLTNTFGSDSLAFKYNGVKCGIVGNDFDFGTYRNFSSDTTTLIRLPTSDLVNLKMSSFRDGILQQDTTFVFPTTPGDTVQLVTVY